MKFSPSLEASILQLKILSLFRSLPLSLTCHTVIDISVSYLDQETMRCFHLINISFISVLQCSCNAKCTHKLQGVSYCGYLHILKTFITILLKEKGVVQMSRPADVSLKVLSAEV